MIIRVKGVGLVRKKTKSRAGERILKLPTSVGTMLHARFADGPASRRPLFPDTRGGYRDPEQQLAATSEMHVETACCRG